MQGSGPRGAPIQVLRMIARLNVGGPSIQVVNLTRRMDRLGYRTLLLRGEEGSHEGSMDYLADELGVRPVKVPGLRREVGWHDLRALLHTWRWILRVRPHILHTHTAKAGTIGRVAALLCGPLRPRVIVHTFHGHVLRGEFSARASRLIARVESLLAKRTTRLIAVSDEIRDDLVEFGVAPPEKIEVVRLGFDLSRFTEQDDRRAEIRGATRQRLGIPDDVQLVTIIARVVKVKRIDRFIAMAGELADRPRTWFLVAGDGDRLEELRASRPAQALGERLVWAGFERDIAAIAFASDLVVLTSDNEGTPVCLIEAQAAALPVVTTRVGGVETVVVDGETGRIVAAEPQALAGAAAAYLDDPSASRRAGLAGRSRVVARFGVDRLVSDIAALYERLLAA
jgi:glycosyltransferase involved in cell wall biosynthesis